MTAPAAKYALGAGGWESYLLIGFQLLPCICRPSPSLCPSYLRASPCSAKFSLTEALCPGTRWGLLAYHPWEALTSVSLRRKWAEQGFQGPCNSEQSWTKGIIQSRYTGGCAEGLLSATIWLGYRLEEQRTRVGPCLGEAQAAQGDHQSCLRAGSPGLRAGSPLGV